MPVEISLPACRPPMGENAKQAIDPRYGTLPALLLQVGISLASHA
jgi:hypothetical protein